MPARKKSDLSYRSKRAERSRVKRSLKKSEESHAARLAQQRSAWYQETVAQSEHRLERNHIQISNLHERRGRTKAEEELDKFKRRLIRTVARLLLHEKKSEAEIWTHLKKETGCDCQLLWTRMRALTVKKLDRLLMAGDHMNVIPTVARMSLTDWLLFDLVLVHQKIDLIGLSNPDIKDDPVALVELFKLVKKFNLEFLTGDELAEAWSSATLHYNNQGHHCSPMLLQRRWYQLKEVTRSKFYNFWYAYGGTNKKLYLAEPFRPTPLQTQVAKWLKSLIIDPFYDWEELIELRRVTLPEEFERKMLERSMNTRPVRKPSDDGPELVMIEPRIETIDLRLEDDDNEKEDQRNEEEKTLPPLVRIKEEPPDTDIDIDETQLQPPKKSIYEEVLESTYMENEKLDSIDDEEPLGEDNEAEEVDTEDTHEVIQEESVWPQITNVIGNVSDTTVILNENDSGDRVGSETVSNIDDNNISTVNDTDTSVLDNDTDNIENVSGTIGVTSSGLDDGTEVPDDVTNISDNDHDVADTGGTDNVEDRSNSDSANLSDVNVQTNSKVTDMEPKSREISDGASSVVSNINETVEADNIEVSRKIDSINENVPDVNPLNAKTSDSTVTDVEPASDVEIIETISHPVVISDSDNDDIDNRNIANKPIDQTKEVEENPQDKAVESILTDDSSMIQPMELELPEELEGPIPEPLVNKDSSKGEDIKPVVDVNNFSFGLLSTDISFADEGIEFVDEGIIYVDEDGHNNIKTETEENNEENSDDPPKIDPKLLMYPIVYTTRLDDMGLFHTQSFSHVKNNKLLGAIILKSKPMKTIPVSASNVVDTAIFDNNIPIKQESLSDCNKRVDNVDNNSKDRTVPLSSNEIIQDALINDSQSTSDDDDCNFIPESQRVKPTSYLLQKPRSRNYHPIQLCKNPDFNTRLKRLNVGFFSYPRNRVLIKNCKPLTIDLSKAFESKLVDGTLYLKPTDQKVVTEVIDDTESHNVSVLPSAMPAQSLIDNTKISDIASSPLLRGPLLHESSKLPDVSTTVERNKVINLPDITEIRRINQRLLTAEVTPIQVQNREPQVPVTIITSPNTSTVVSQKSITAEVSEKDLPTDANDSRGPPKLVDITIDLPDITNRHSNNLSLSSASYNRPVLAGHASRVSQIGNKKKYCQPKAVPWRTKLSFRPEVPWLSRKCDAKITNRQMQETLLTLDALNKMLYVLTNQEEPEALVAKTAKVKKKKRNKSLMKSKQQEIGDINYMLVPASKPDDNPENQTTKRCIPKINVIHATGYYAPNQKETQNKTGDADKSVPVVLQELLQEEKTEQVPVSKPSEEFEENEIDMSKHSAQYCCWARQRMLQLVFSRKFLPEHECELSKCQCCCRKVLKHYVLNDQKIKGSANQTEKEKKLQIKLWKEKVIKLSNVNLVDDDTDHDVAGETHKDSAKEIVQVPSDTPFIEIEIPPTRVTSNIGDSEPIDIDAMDTEDSVPSLGGEVSVATTPVLPVARGIKTTANVVAGRTIVAIPVAKKRKIKTSTITSQNSSHQLVSISSDNLAGGVLLSAKNTNQSNVSAVKQFVTVKKNFFKPNFIVPPKFKPLAPKKVQEKMIFINSKQISEKPSENPIFLGKNKILLTTVKFPPKLKLFEDAKKFVESTVNIPQGVRLIYMPNDTITYHIDRDVAVNATDLIEMPAIIVAIQKRMDELEAREAQNIPPNVGVNPNEVVDLLDDDDDSAVNVASNENKTSTVTDINTTVQNVTISCDSPQFEIERSNQTGDCIDSNINKNTINTQAENNQNDSVDKIIVEEKAEEISVDKLSAQAEQAGDQPESLSQNISSEETNLPKSLSLTESKNINEKSIEPAQNQTDPTSQNSADDNSECPSKNVSTNTQETLTEPNQNQIDLPSQVEIQKLQEPSSQSDSTVTQEAEERITEPNRNKTKNILSDLMEMSGIFDEEPEVTLPGQTAEAVARQITVQSDVEVPALGSISVSTTSPVIKPIVIPPAINNTSSRAPIKAILGELTPITSLYELKYACFHNGKFFKLDFDTGYLLPINVCMKQHKVPPPMPKKTLNSQNITKSFIDLTEDDDAATITGQPPESVTEPVPESVTDIVPKPVTQPEVTESGTSPSKRSLLLLNNLFPTTNNMVSGADSVKPVKMFKALKPDILHKLNQEKNKLQKRNAVESDHKQKRKQFLISMNLNDETNIKEDAAQKDDATDNDVERDINLMRQPFKKIKLKRNLYNAAKVPASEAPVASTSQTNNNFATTTSSDDSDDEPLAKIAKRKQEKENSSLICEDRLVEQTVADTDDVEMRDIDLNKDAESVQPVVDAESQEVAEDGESPEYLDDDLLEQEAPFGFDVDPNEEEEFCILGV